MFKKLLTAGAALAIAAALLTGCGGPSYKDGVYKAEQDEFADNGWKSYVTITVKDGKITDAEWNAINKDGGDDKVTQSKDGRYGMVAKGGAKLEWHEQAELVEKYLIEKQDPTDIKYTDDEGHTDAISGATIHVKEFFDLAQKALEDAKK